MSSKHRVCCCGSTPAQPCCQYATLNSIADANESTQIHFDGLNSIPEAQVLTAPVPDPLPSPGTEPGNLTFTESLYLNDGIGFFTAQSAAGLYSGNTRLEALNNLLANNAPITVNFSRLRVPIDNSSLARPLHRYQQWLALGPPQLYRNYWNGTSWATTAWTPTLPYCGYAVFGFPATIEHTEFVDGSTASNSTPGLFAYFVSRGRRLVGGVPEKYYAWAEKITSYDPYWFLEPFRYVNDVGPVRWSSGHCLGFRGCLQENNAQLNAYSWETSGKPASPPYLNVGITSVAFGAGYPDLVFSLMSSGPGNGCPVGLTFGENGARSATDYRGTCAAYLTRAYFDVRVGTIGLTTGAGLGLRRFTATTSQSTPSELGAPVYVDPSPPGGEIWLPMAFSKVPQNITLTVNP